MRRIVVMNQKGGVGKTTTVCNLGAAASARGKHVLAIDLDPQAHLTLHFGVDPSPDRPGVYDVLTRGRPLDEVTLKVRKNLHLAPSLTRLAGAETELVSVVGREVILRDAVEATQTDYDIVLFDCPPSLGILTLNGLAAADEVIIPLQAHFLGLQGMSELLRTISLVQRRVNAALRVEGVILCMFETGTKLAAEVVDDLQRFLASARGSDVPWADAKLYDAVIRRNIKLAECPSYGMTIFDYAPRSNGALDYARLATEVLEPAAAPSQTPEDSRTGAAHPSPQEPQVRIGSESASDSSIANIA